MTLPAHVRCHFGTYGPPEVIFRLIKILPLGRSEESGKACALYWRHIVGKSEYARFCILY